MEYKKEMKRRTTITKEILKSIRKSIGKDYSARKAAEEAEISSACAQTLINKIQSGLADEDILDTKKGRPKKINMEMELQVISIL